MKQGNSLITFVILALAAVVSIYLGTYAFNSLEDLLEGNISGNAFHRERQLRAYGRIAANNDGTCGEKVHRFLCRSLGL